MAEKLTRAEQAAARREELIQISVRHFASKGFDGTSLDDVAADAGVAKGLLYHYFGSKRDLFLAGIASLDLETILDALPGIVEGSPLTESIPLLVDEWAEVLEAHLEEFRFFVSAAVTGNEEAMDQIASLLRSFEDRVAEIISAAPDVDANVNATMAAAAFVGALTSLMLRRGIDRDWRDEKAYRRQLVRMTVRGLSGTGP